MQFNIRDLALAVLLIAIALYWYGTAGPNGTIQTDRELDLAIDGRGYFQVTDTGSGQRCYTRSGKMSLQPDGQLCVETDRDQWLLEPVINVPQDWVTINFDKNGNVSYLDGAQVNCNTGALELARFQNEEALNEIFPNIFAETKDSGSPIVGRPGVDGFGFTRQGWLENSGRVLDKTYLPVIAVFLIVTGYLLYEFRRLGRKVDACLKVISERN